MALTLAVADNQAGTGATATISGGDVGSTYTVYTQTPATTGTTWTSGGSRTGNGTVSLSLANGYYWAYASGNISGSPTISNIVYFAATASTQSMQEKVQNAVKAAIQTMCGVSLVGISSDNVYLQMGLDDKYAKFPGIFLNPTSAEQFVGGTNQRDDVGHPVVVLIVDRNHEDYVTNMPTYLLWREKIIRKFINQRLSAVSEHTICNVEPGPIFDPKLPAYHYMVSAFTLRFFCREPRGV